MAEGTATLSDQPKLIAYTNIDEDELDLRVESVKKRENRHLHVIMKQPDNRYTIVLMLKH